MKSLNGYAETTSYCTPLGKDALILRNHVFWKTPQARDADNVIGTAHEEKREKADLKSTALSAEAEEIQKQRESTSGAG